MTIAAPKITLQEFLQLPDIEESHAWEYINGKGVQKPMGGGKHSTLQKGLVPAIDHAGTHYEAFLELRCTFGNRSIVPDVVIIAKSQLPLDESGDISSTGIEFAPLWVIEILSPAQSQTKVTGNILHCLRHGSRLGWLLDPNERSVLVYWPDRLPDLLFGADQLPALDGIALQLSVETVYGWLRRTS